MVDFGKVNIDVKYSYLWATSCVLSGGPVLIESSGGSTTPRYPEHCEAPSELGDTPC